MKHIRIPIERLSGNQDLPLPQYMTEKSAGMDIHAAVKDDLTLMPGQRVMVPTGFAISLPDGYEAQIRPRSGLAFKHGVTLMNGPGTIDADYRGEIGILLVNLGDLPFTIQRGDRIAQMVLHEICQASWDLSNALDATQRGSGGFGHTGQ
jgi:dUTP pyrophosphatase